MTRLEEWAKRVENAMHDAGWLQGGEDGQLRAQAVLKREARAFVQEALDAHVGKFFDVSAFLDCPAASTEKPEDAWDSHAFCWAHGMCMARSTDPLPQHGNVCQDMTAALGKPGHLGAASPDWAAATPWPPKCAMCRDKRYIQVTCGDDFSATESKPCPACQHPTPSTSP